MNLSQAATLLISAISHVNAQKCDLEKMPVNKDDFDEPDWEKILTLAFPEWERPKAGCPRLDSLSGNITEGFTEFPVYEEGKWNPCYYTKAFAGLDPALGGYPTPVDTKYVYEFAAPFLKQPGDGSVHHCAYDASDVGACPKFQNDCGKDCASITEEFGIGHVPPFVPLAAVKNAYNACEEDICAEWFDEESECSIKKSKLDQLVVKYFGTEENNVKFPGPVLIDGEPSDTYYRLEYLGQSPDCDAGNCRGPHYCSVEAAEAGGIWGDWCPYIHTGENSGQYRHPHLALAALELWIANQCMPDKCASEWLDSPNGQGYAADPMKTTSITWAEMIDNNDPMSQPLVPYAWPNSGDGVYPGLEKLYGDAESKDIAFTTTLPDLEYTEPETTATTTEAPPETTEAPIVEEVETTTTTEAPPTTTEAAMDEPATNDEIVDEEPATNDEVPDEDMDTEPDAATDTDNSGAKYGSVVAAIMSVIGAIAM